ncbi:RINT-1/TIP-20 [Xylaria scruposa]|nr:RINT-1/TIP-20 [Xylaria scruposa]
MAFLASALSTAVYRRVWRTALEKIQEMLWGDVLLKQNFTTLGAAQLVDSTGRLKSCAPSRKVSIIREPSGIWRSTSEKMACRSCTNGGITLQQVTDRVFTDNTEAKKTLAELELETLTLSHARKILQRRVENSE